MKHTVLALFLLTTSSVGLNLNQLIYKINQAPFNRLETGIIIEEFNNKVPLYAINSHKLLPPASLVKLVLTATCLTNIGSHFQYKTAVYLDKATPPNLYISGAGDPNTTLAQIEKIGTKLRKKHISTLNQIHINTKGMSTKQHRYDQSSKYYYAPYGAININYNQVSCRFNPQDKQFFITPQSAFTIVDATKANFQSSSKRYYPSIALTQSKQNDIYKIHGNFSKNDLKSNDFNFRVSRPNLHAAYVIQHQLNNQDITILKPPSSGQYSLKGLKKILTLTSKPLPYYLDILNKQSNNMLAEALTEILTNMTKQPSDKPITQMEDYLNKHTTNIPFFLYDGSGLDPRNKLTVIHILDTLKHSHATFHDKFLSMLVYANTDQDYKHITIDKRYNVYVKSGTLSSNGVNNLAGIIYDKQIDTYYYFVFMTQAPLNKRPAYKGQYTSPLLEALLTKRS